MRSWLDAAMPRTDKWVMQVVRVVAWAALVVGFLVARMRPQEGPRFWIATGCYVMGFVGVITVPCTAAPSDVRRVTALATHARERSVFGIIGLPSP